MIITCLGRNSAQIIKDAVQAFPNEREIIVISRDGDTLTPPDGVACIQVSQFAPSRGEEYLFVANGGTTAQAMVILRRLLESGADFGVYDIQPDGVCELWPFVDASKRASMIAEGCGERLVSTLWPDEVRELWFRTPW